MSIDKNIPVTDWCKHKALFFDDLGRFVGKKRLDFKSSTFIFQGRGYNFVPSEASYFKISSLLSSTKYYFYNINNPMPLLLDKKQEPLINSEAYGVCLRTDILKKLNDLSKPDWLKALLTPRNIIIALILLLVIWYFSSGGSVSDLTKSVTSIGSSTSS